METSMATRKLQAIELITKLENEDLLSLIEQLLLGEKGEAEMDWAESLNENDKIKIRKGLEDLEKGNTVSYEDFKKEIKKRFP